MRYLFLILLVTLTLICIITLHMNPLHALLFVVFGSLITSATEFQVHYNFVDWLKDHILSLFGWFQSYSHAKISTLEARAAMLKAKVRVEEQRIEARMRALAARMGVGRR